MQVNILPRGLHTRPQDWPNPWKWDPERFLDASAIASRHPHAYMPFGYGARSCIGQFFALWEARTCLAMLLDRFEIALPSGKSALPPSIHPSIHSFIYRLPNTHTDAASPSLFSPFPPGYTMVPDRASGFAPFPGNLSVVFTERDAAVATAVPAAPAPSSSPSMPPPVQAAALGVSGTGVRAPMILYGSNAGACEELATQLAEQAKTLGLEGSPMSLDGYLDAHGGDGALHDKLFIIVCSTYNGEPPDNARRFVSHLSQASVTAKELKFAMVGVGNSMWAATFHKVPKGIVSKLDALGGEALLEHAYLDVSTSSWTEDWEVSLRACVCVRVLACVRACASGRSFFPPLTSVAASILQRYNMALWPCILDAIGVTPKPETMKVALAQPKQGSFVQVRVLREGEGTDLQRMVDFVVAHPNLKMKKLPVVSNCELQSPGSKRSTREIVLSKYSAPRPPPATHFFSLS